MAAVSVAVLAGVAGSCAAAITVCVLAAADAAPVTAIGFNRARTKY